MVWINVDETSVQFGFNKKKGTVLKESSWLDAEPTMSTANMHERFSLADVRARVSYIAAAASDLEVQRALPQVLLMNTRFATKKLLAYAQETMPQNCDVWVDDSAWVSTSKFFLYLEHLHEVVQQVAKDCLIIVVLDSLSCHINQNIADFAFSVGFILIIIPGGLTWLLQVLDVYGFAKFKQSLQKHLCEERIKAQDGQLNKEMWLDVVEDNNLSMKLDTDQSPSLFTCMHGRPISIHHPHLCLDRSTQPPSPDPSLFLLFGSIFVFLASPINVWSIWQCV